MLHAMLSDDQVREHIKTIAVLIRKEEPPQSAEEKAAFKAACALVADAFITVHTIAEAAERQAEALTRLADVAERIEPQR